MEGEDEGEIVDGGWGKGWDWRDGEWRLRSEMEGEAKVEIGDGGWGKGFGSEMEGKEKVKIGDGGWGEGFWSEMEGEREDGGWSGSSEGDRVQNVSEENKRKKNEGIAQKKIKDKRPMAACIKRGHSSIQKKRGYSCKKRSFRPRLRPRV